jgi:hypothetical protein
MLLPFPSTILSIPQLGFNNNFFQVNENRNNIKGTVLCFTTKYLLERTSLKGEEWRFLAKSTRPSSCESHLKFPIASLVFKD